jgi:hypothetical protein
MSFPLSVVSAAFDFGDQGIECDMLMIAAVVVGD